MNSWSTDSVHQLVKIKTNYAEFALIVDLSPLCCNDDDSAAEDEDLDLEDRPAADDDAARQ